MSDDLIKRIKEGCAGRDRWYVMNAAEDGYCMDFDWQLTADQWMAERLRENPDYIKRNGYHVVKKRSFTSAEELANEAAAMIEQQAARIAELETEIVKLMHDIERHIANHIADLDAVFLAPVAPAVDAQPVAWESTTPVYRRFITDTRYQMLRPEARKWYKPYRCAHCASAQSEGWRKDAERYRWLVKNCFDWAAPGDGDSFDHIELHFEHDMLSRDDDSVGAAIDAEIAREAGSR